MVIWRLEDLLLNSWRNRTFQIDMLHHRLEEIDESLYEETGIDISATIIEVFELKGSLADMKKQIFGKLPHIPDTQLYFENIILEKKRKYRNTVYELIDDNPTGLQFETLKLLNLWPTASIAFFMTLQEHNPVLSHFYHLLAKTKKGEFNNFVKEVATGVSDALLLIELADSAGNLRPIDFKAQRTVEFDRSRNEEVFDFLKKFIVGEDEHQLCELLNGKSIHDRIRFKLKLKEIAHIFKTFHEHKVILGAKKDTQDWLVNNFRYYNSVDRKYMDINPATIHEYISTDKKDKIKENRISIPFLEII